MGSRELFVGVTLLLGTTGAPGPLAAVQSSVEVFAPGIVTVEGQSLYRGRFSPTGNASTSSGG